ncbi:MAG: hypothetical protein IJW81_12245 [Clostridia bacterium]|nr:hypothetical protein [Clostridia bacterium]
MSGASGSGKSTFADALRTYLESRQKTVCVIAADRYFKKDLPKMISPADGEEYSDWNHPDSVDMPAFLAAVREAMDSGEYDFVLIEGVTIFCHETVREMADVKLYVDASIEMRIYRRIARNVVTKGQTIEFIGGYYLKCARYRETEYSLPSAKYADWHIDNEWGFDIEAEGEKIINKLITKD